MPRTVEERFPFPNHLSTSTRAQEAIRRGARDVAFMLEMHLPDDDVRRIKALDSLELACTHSDAVFARHQLENQ